MNTITRGPPVATGTRPELADLVAAVAAYNMVSRFPVALNFGR